MTNEELMAEVKRLEHLVNYWRIEAETDHARWLRVLEENERIKAEMTDCKSTGDRLKADVEDLKAKMKDLPTKRIGDRWYTEAEFQIRINDARFWRL
jgi:hypothetical protein